MSERRNALTKQQQIDQLTELNRLLTENVNLLEKKVRDMIEARDDDFSHSTIYMEMKRKLLLADTLKDCENRIKRQEINYARLYEEMKTLREDNEALCGEHGIDYWKGIASRKAWDDQAALEAEREIMELKAQVAAKDAVIEHLKVVAAGGEPSPAMHKNGRPKKIDEATQKRVRKLRREGWTLQQIAEAEGISKGSVAMITKGTKNKAKE